MTEKTFLHITAFHIVTEYNIQIPIKTIADIYPIAPKIRFELITSEELNKSFINFFIMMLSFLYDRLRHNLILNRLFHRDFSQNSFSHPEVLMYEIQVFDSF